MCYSANNSWKYIEYAKHKAFLHLENTLELSGKRIWLTGASSGIGRALAHELARRGAVLALTSRNCAELDRLAQELRSNGTRVTVVSGDVSIEPR